ncbi:hypothetical protein HPP92_011040 [Vanilla planifolia]|uniref:Uncharacterized protein n=1 Tax=Vanilla planifolia TaxID=51239 RepID=A0A835R598_VANPL|nr:hypothetical protein HPP92_011040 [Vanilla planifolia]
MALSSSREISNIILANQVASYRPSLELPRQLAYEPSQLAVIIFQPSILKQSTLAKFDRFPCNLWPASLDAGCHQHPKEHCSRRPRNDISGIQ